MQHRIGESGIELGRDVQRMVVAAFVHLMAFKRRTDEDRQHQLAVLPRDLRQRQDGSGAGSFPACADYDDDGVPGDQRFDLASGFLQCHPRYVGAVTRAETARRPWPDQQAF